MVENSKFSRHFSVLSARALYGITYGMSHRKISVLYRKMFLDSTLRCPYGEVLLFIIFIFTVMHVYGIPYGVHIPYILQVTS